MLRSLGPTAKLLAPSSSRGSLPARPLTGVLAVNSRRAHCSAHFFSPFPQTQVAGGRMEAFPGQDGSLSRAPLPAVRGTGAAKGPGSLQIGSRSLVPWLAPNTLGTAVNLQHTHTPSLQQPLISTTVRTGWQGLERMTQDKKHARQCCKATPRT